MRRIHILICFFLAILLGLSSCEKGGGSGGYIIDGPLNSIFFGTPRECEQMLVRPLHIVQTQMPGGYTSSEYVLVEKPIKSEDYIHSVVTGGSHLEKTYDKQPMGFSLDNYYFSRVDDADPTISEEEHRHIMEVMHEDFQDYYKELLRTVAYSWSYGTTNLVDFEIQALEPIFGKQAETSLNKYFQIVDYLPEQILTRDGDKLRLVRSYSDRNAPLTIEEWLKLKPTASPIMRLKLKSRPQEAPLDVHFVTILKTKDKELRDTVSLRLL